jgi:glutamyl-tRNA reductase
VIVVVGLSHRSATIDVRERLAMPADVISGFLADLVADQAVAEALLLSTCNRVEVVAAGHEGAASPLEPIAGAVQKRLSMRAPGVASHLYTHAGAEGVKHLFRVAASLDSLVLGEPQILGQLKDAFELAKSAGSVGPVLHRVLPRALRTAKRVRSETAIGSGQVSVPTVAVDLARQIFSDLRGRSAVLIGSGAMAENVALLLNNLGAKLEVIGRSPERTQRLAREVGGTAHSFDELDAVLLRADVVISSTSAPGFVVNREGVLRARRSRKGRSLFFIDLAVPRDIDPLIGEIDGMFVYNIDDFERVVAESLSGRQREAQRAEQIVVEQVLGWERWNEAAQATPTIVALRARLRAVLMNELDRSMRSRLKHLGATERDALTAMAEAALNKMLHTASVRLRDAALERSGLESDRLERLVQSLSELFALDRDLDLDELDEQAAGETSATELPEPPEPPDSDPIPPAPAGARVAR